MKTQFSNEHRLLMALLRSRGDQEQETEITGLCHQVHWPSFIQMARVDLHPYLAFRLEAYRDRVAVPAEWNVLFTRRRLTAIYNLQLRHELRRITAELIKCGIPSLTLKGMVLAHTIYPDPSLRPMSDLDLLVPPENREESLRVLERLGYAYPEAGLAAPQEPRAVPGQEYAPPLRLRGSPICVEVHSQLECSEPLFPVPIDEFWSRSIVVDLNGLKVRTLSWEDFLFHLCLHQSRSHRFQKGLLPMIDVRYLLAFWTDWNWPAIASRAIRNRCATWMHLTLGAARDLAGAAVPESLFEALPEPQDISTLRRMLEEQVCSAETSSFPLLSVLVAEPSWKCRARLLSRRLRLIVQANGVLVLTFAGLIDRTQLLYRQLRVAFKTKILVYLRGWRNGQLSVESVRRGARLHRDANSLFELVLQQESTCPASTRPE